MRFNVFSAASRNVVATFVLVLALGFAAYGQAGSSSVTGSVTDAQGQGVAGATVSLVSQQGTRRNTTSDSNGSYLFASVQPGAYKIEVEATGFNRSVTTAFDALTDRVVTIPVKLNV